MKIGYARVSTDDQTLRAQLLALRGAGCERIFTDKRPGHREDRSGLARALNALKEGDVLVVYRLDRLARSLRHFLDLMAHITARGAALHSLCESIETDTAVGRLIVHVLASLGEFERDLISERTKTGMDAAKLRGSTFGRPPALSETGRRRALALKAQGMPVPQIAAEIGVGRSTLYRHLN